MRAPTLLLLTLLSFAPALGQSPAQTTPPPAATSQAAAELSATDAIILGVVEGVTEYLPVSSTGHLIIANHFLGLESDAPLVGPTGEPLWYRRPSEKNPAGEPLTVKLAADTYCVVIQFGAIAAVLLLYWSRVVSLFRGLVGRDPAGRQLLINLIVAFVPAAGLGFLFHDWIDARLFSVPAVILALVAGAALMFAAEAWRKRRAPSIDLTTGELTTKAAAGIGALQCLALWPGMSRSMTTIVGGYFAGLDPKRAAEFSFLLGLVTLSAAALYKSYRSGAAMIEVFGWTKIILGCIVAAVVAAVCVRFLVHWLTKHGLAIFAWYRIVLAAVLAFVFYS